MKKIVGIQKREGVIDGKGYVNYRYYIQDLNPKDCVGISVEAIKVKSNVHNNFKEKNKGLDFEFENVLYDAYKNVADLV